MLKFQKQSEGEYFGPSRNRISKFKGYQGKLDTI